MIDRRTKVRTGRNQPNFSMGKGKKPMEAEKVVEDMQDGKKEAKKVWVQK